MNADALIMEILFDCQTAVRELVGGNHIVWCDCMAKIAQKLSALKDGIASDAKAKEKTIQAQKEIIEALKTRLRKSGAEVIERSETDGTD